MEPQVKKVNPQDGQNGLKAHQLAMGVKDRGERYRKK